MGNQIPVTILTRSSHSARTQLFRHILNTPDKHQIALILQIERSDEAAGMLVEAGSGHLVHRAGDALGSVLDTLIEQQLQGKVGFERVLIEAPGLDPWLVSAPFFQRRRLAEFFMLDQIVAVVEAQHIVELLETDAAALEGLGYADSIVVSGLEGATAQRRAAVQDSLAWASPHTPVFAVEQGKALSTRMFPPGLTRALPALRSVPAARL
jgi:G3E family GTPase